MFLQSDGSSSLIPLANFPQNRIIIYWSRNKASYESDISSISLTTNSISILLS